MDSNKDATENLGSSRCSTAFKGAVDKARRKWIKAERISEIREVKRVLVQQGSHPHVSPVVARWFRNQGFKTNCSTRQKGWFCVWVDG